MKLWRTIYIAIAILAFTGLDVLCSEGIFKEMPAPGQAEGYTFSRTYVGLPVERSTIIDQLDVSDVLCGPTAVLNAMIFGNDYMKACYRTIPGRNSSDKLHFVVNEYGQKPSGEYENRFRIDKQGICSPDLLDLFNDLLVKTGMMRVEGRYVLKGKNESAGEFLIRSHNILLKSLINGVPVVAHIRSFGAKRSPEKDKMYWYGLSSHFLTITKIPEKLSDYEKGFVFQYIDPFQAKVENGYIGVELNRGFNAKLGVDKNSTWIGGKSFLLVRAPSLNLMTSEQEWHNRTIMTLNYVIGDMQ